MSPDAALLLLSVATAFVFVSTHSTCRNTVHCSCLTTRRKFTVCAEQNMTAADPCSRWPGCKTCHEDPSCVTATNRTLRSRQKRQASYATKRWHSHPARLSEGDGDCSEAIDSPKLGSIRCTSSRGRKTCTGTCLPGYTFERRYEETEMVLSCLNGRWTPARTFPPCISGGHCDLEVHRHGRFNCTTGMQGTRCDVFCATRYAGRFHCFPGRPWEPTLPQCVRSKGGESGNPPRCRCEYGASCDINGRCICPAGRTGTHCESIIAEKKSCSDPGLLSNGYRTNLNGGESNRRRNFEDGESLLFGCRSTEYALQGSPIMTCRDGMWSKKLPKCIQSNPTPVVTCPDPGQVANADRLNADGSLSMGAQSYRIGQSVAYTCRAGYALHRSSLITCKSSGSWSDFLPYCTPIPIPAPETVISTSTASHDHRGRIVYCRDPGRVWNGNRFPVDAPNNRGFPQGSSLEYSCNQGYTLKGVGSIFCLVSGSWSFALPRCEEQPIGEGEFCLNPVSIENGKITLYPNTNSQRGSEVRHDDVHYPPNSRLVYSCNEGYQLRGTSEMTCRGDNGVWSTDPPTCVPGTATRYCKNPGPLVNGQRVLFRSVNNRPGSLQGSTENLEYPDGARFEYSCDVGYTMNGRRSHTCETGYWSSPKPTCKIGPIVYCDVPEPIINGRVEHFPPAMSPKSGLSISETDIEYPEGTRLQYSCDDGFLILGPNSLSCLSTSQWSSDPPICSAECGRPSAGSSTKMFRGNVSVAGEWPWVVSIRENEASEITCGGAVLNSRTVVTAAHCVSDTSKSYILYFGKIRQLDKDDDELVMKRTSTRIILHPYYSEQTMDSDIGLIQFSDPIRLTDRIQPICLPDKESTTKNLRTGSMGYVAGFGVNELGVQPNNLMYIRIPVQSNEVCVDYYKAQRINLIMSQNMFCAGYPGADQATCEGDSGSALVFFDRVMEHYIMEGVVSFATNGQCGTFGQYIVFTRVYPYVPWLLKNLG